MKDTQFGIVAGTLAGLAILTFGAWSPLAVAIIGFVGGVLGFFLILLLILLGGAA